MKPRVAVILGPTATGKSHCGIALAKRLNGEIISGDSMLVIKEWILVQLNLLLKNWRQYRTI